MDQDEETHGSDSIAKNAMLGEKKVSEEIWAGGETHNLDGYGEDEIANSEKENFIQEQLYIHGKVSLCSTLHLSYAELTVDCSFSLPMIV